MGELAGSRLQTTTNAVATVDAKHHLCGLAGEARKRTLILPIGGGSSLTLLWILARRPTWLPSIRMCCPTCRGASACSRLRMIWWLLATSLTAHAQPKIQMARSWQSSTALGSHGLQILQPR